MTATIAALPLPEGSTVPSDGVVRQRNSSNTTRASSSVAYAAGRDLAADRPSSAELWLKLSAELRFPDGEVRCYLCRCVVRSDSDWELEHVDPLCLGGLHHIDNLELACPDCNRTKGGFTLEELFGPDDAAAIRHFAPDLSELSGRPVEGLWDSQLNEEGARRRRLVKRISRRPRTGTRPVPVPLDDGLDRMIYQVLRRHNGGNPWAAMPIRAINEVLRNEHGNLGQRWDLMMGMTSAPSRVRYFDERYISGRIEATWVEQKRGFCIRRDIDPREPIS